MPKFVTVAVPCPLRRGFDYLWPDTLQQEAKVGMRVSVPFGPRRLVGVIFATPTNSDIAKQKMKSVIKALDESPCLPPDLIQLGLWAAAYYHHPVGECFQQLLPITLRKAEPAKEKPAQYWQCSDDITNLPPLPSRAHQQQSLLAVIEQSGRLSRRQIKDLGYSNTVLNNLINGGYLSKAEAPLAAATSTPSTKLSLNTEQDHAVKAISKALGGFDRFLLDGVTGSGKTEVYLRAIEDCLGRGEQTLVLIPEIGLTPQTLQRFEQRFPTNVSTLHSGLSDSERVQNWKKIQSGEHKILLGTRSAVLTPFHKLGLIIVDEEHDASYKQQDGWRYSARDIAVKRGSDHCCPVVLGSATPSLDSLHNVALGRYQLLELRERAGGANAPKVHLLDIRNETLDAGLGKSLLDATAQTLNEGNQALIFLNRRGFSPQLQCHSCGWLANCQACDATLTVHFGRRELRCHHCGATETLPTICPQCHNHELIFQGPGTERLELSLKQHFPDVPIIRIDRDTTSAKGSMQLLIDDIHTGKPCILVGTQMLAKGHHFPDVTLVGIIDIDGGLFSADFRGPERSGQLLIQVAGRAGRANKPGKVYIQSHCPDHPALQALVNQGYQPFAQQLLAERKLFSLPPVSFSAVIRADAVSLESAEAFLSQIINALPTGDTAWSIVGPLPAPMARKAGRFRAALILQSERRSLLHQHLHAACEIGDQLRKPQNLRWSVDVDPIDLF
ncbi:Primosomal protein N' [Zhongshania aliphaticivorans]|uniref:Replication restart protein PriA n=1 Tax=Zhongshania aliphaticivorans TaxID=1470434 RepID=A0A5S9N8A1_9GAMM|nr:primosomal protein N' [Zhongshania aliphaticivorans]CAA0079376.1 Primosomal protein N' [Zhongshania aliphaticivorans]CAA0086223.1 Primosomal protein N' [Zhongshania aliphaticivorans]